MITVRAYENETLCYDADRWEVDPKGNLLLFSAGLEVAFFKAYTYKSVEDTDYREYPDKKPVPTIKDFKDEVS